MNNAPKRLQWMLRCLQRYYFVLKFLQGREIIASDTLSRAYPPKLDKLASESFTEELAMVSEDSIFQSEIQEIKDLDFVVTSDELKTILQRESEHDTVINKLRNYMQDGWQRQFLMFHPRFVIFSFRDVLILEDGLLFNGSRLYVPARVRDEILQRIHASHIGFQGCLCLARDSVFWPGMSHDIQRIVATCTVFAKIQHEQAKEPLMLHSIQYCPWQQVGCDLFEYNHVACLITVDYYNNFFEVDHQSDKRAPEIIRHSKNNFVAMVYQTSS